jgi:hypothetical protein
MALAFSRLDQNEVTPSSGVTTTASVTYTENALINVQFSARASSTVFGGTNFTVSGLGLTWVRGKEKPDTSALHDRVGAWFYSLGGGNTGTITITGPSDLLDVTYDVVQVTGVVTTGSNGAGAVNNVSPLDSNAGTSTSGATQPSLTITGTPSGGDMTFAMCMMEDTESGETEKSGWTNIAKVIGTAEVSIDAMYNTSADQSPSWSGLRTDGRSWATIGAIIKAAAVIPQVPRQSYMVNILTQ